MGEELVELERRGLSVCPQRRGGWILREGRCTPGWILWMDGGTLQLFLIDGVVVDYGRDAD